MFVSSSTRSSGTGIIVFRLCAILYGRSGCNRSPRWIFHVNAARFIFASRHLYYVSSQSTGSKFFARLLRSGCLFPLRARSSLLFVHKISRKQRFQVGQCSSGVYCRLSLVRAPNNSRAVRGELISRKQTAKVKGKEKGRRAVSGHGRDLSVPKVRLTKLVWGFSPSLNAYCRVHRHFSCNQQW